MAADAQLTAGMRKDFVGQLNKVLQRKDFYDAAAGKAPRCPNPCRRWSMPNRRPGRT